MQPKEFFQKLTSRYLWLNLLAMGLLVVLLAIGVHVALNLYTHHGETVSVPDVRKQSFESAVRTMEARGLTVEVNDTGYVKSLPPGTILEQLPAAGTRVKTGRVIYVTINATDSPTLALPDIIDNSSLREAQAKLSSMGFKLGSPKLVPGEKDWVYGVLCRGRRVSAGERVSIDHPLTLMIGSGEYDSDEEIDYIEPEYRLMESGNVDEFEEVVE